MGKTSDPAGGEVRLNAHTINPAGVENLVAGIVNQAVRDWLEAPQGSKTRWEVERFFRSQYCSRLTGLDGRLILRKCLRIEAEKRKKTKRRARP